MLFGPSLFLLQVRRLWKYLVSLADCPGSANPRFRRDEAGIVALGIEHNALSPRSLRVTANSYWVGPGRSRFAAACRLQVIGGISLPGLRMGSGLEQALRQPHF